MMSTSRTSPSWREAPTPTTGAAPDGTEMDTVELLVHDLDAMSRFYREAVTLDVLDESGATVVLGRGGIPIVRLRQEKDLPDRDARGAGLYHTAILFQDQARLASSLASMARHASDLYEGSADHLVSEAFYFHDPEGNGLELYRDRPRDEWSIGPDGTVQMASLPLDPQAFLRRWHDDERTDAHDEASAAIGHVHLQVGDISTARNFYVDTLGFDITFEFGAALFLSAGEYHHHIGVNTWQSAGAGPRAASLGLGDVRIRVPAREDLDALSDRLAFRSIPVRDDGAEIRVADPWGTQLVITADALR